MDKLIDVTSDDREAVNAALARLRTAPLTLEDQYRTDLTARANEIQARLDRQRTAEWLRNEFEGYQPPGDSFRLGLVAGICFALECGLIWHLVRHWNG